MPDVAVLITVRNDPRVTDCVDAVLAQETPFPFEVVVVDNGSTDGTGRVLREKCAGRASVRLVFSEGNLSQAWNEAARATESTILARIDADAQPLKGWLAALVKPLLAGAADWTAGPVSGVDPAVSLVARYFHERTEAYSRRLARDSRLRDAVPSWNVAYRRVALEAAGWYDPWQASSVDWDLHKRLARTGAKGLFVPDARCVHHHPTSLREFARKEAWYRTGQYQMVLKYGMREMAEALVLPIAYALLLILIIGSVFWLPLFWFAIAFLVALVVKHWIDGIRDSDPMWSYRAVFRPIEGFAGLYGLIRGFIRYGIHRRARELAKGLPPVP